MVSNLSWSPFSRIAFTRMIVITTAYCHWEIRLPTPDLSAISDNIPTSSDEDWVTHFRHPYSWPCAMICSTCTSHNWCISTLADFLTNFGRKCLKTSKDWCWLSCWAHTMHWKQLFTWSLYIIRVAPQEWEKTTNGRDTLKIADDQLDYNPSDVFITADDMLYLTGCWQWFGGYHTAPAGLVLLFILPVFNHNPLIGGPVFTPHLYQAFFKKEFLCL